MTNKKSNNNVNKINEKKIKHIDSNSIINEYNSLLMKMENKNCEISKLKKEKKELETHLDSILNSRTYKVARLSSSLVKYPFRLLRRYRNNTENRERVFEKNNDFDRIDVQSLYDKVKMYDYVSFDIFDTLIFRNVVNPTDVFMQIELDEDLYDFYNVRIGAEAAARKNISKANFEINIHDIYSFIGNKYNSSDDDMIEMEFKYELKNCHANPYMKDLYDYLIKNEKKVIITSDMYWPKDYLIKLLNSCGYDKFENLYVSCEYELNKGNGLIQKFISKELNTTNIIHIGDNYQSDILGSKKAGWSTYYYKNIKEISEDTLIQNYDDSIEDSIISEMINEKLFAYPINYTRYYKYGYAYVGSLVAGYINYINMVSKKEKVDKILFLARDSRIVYEAYKKYFDDIPSSYVKISRSSILEANFCNNPQELINFYFNPRVPCKKYKIGETFDECDLSLLNKYISDYELSFDTIICKENYPVIEKMIYDHIDEINAYFESSKKSAISYLKREIGENKKILAVDLGWNGTITSILSNFLNNEISKDIDLIGMFVGNKDSKRVNNLVNANKFYSYCFNYQKKDFYLKLDDIKDNTKAMLLEAIFSSNEPSLLKYDEEFVYGVSTNNAEILNEIHCGILNFIGDVMKCEYGFVFESNVVSCRRLFDILNNYQYSYSIFKDFLEYADSIPRFSKNKKMVSLGKIISDRKLI